MQYYDRLMAIRNDGDWIGWIKFFLRGVFEVSQGATGTARAILDLREEHRKAIAERLSKAPKGFRLLDYLYQQPMITISAAEKFLQCAYATASKVIDDFQTLGILVETTGRARNRYFRYERYWMLFERQVLRSPSKLGPAQTTLAKSTQNSKRHPPLR